MNTYEVGEKVETDNDKQTRFVLSNSISQVGNWAFWHWRLASMGKVSHSAGMAY